MQPRGHFQTPREMKTVRQVDKGNTEPLTQGCPPHDCVLNPPCFVVRDFSLWSCGFLSCPFDGTRRTAPLGLYPQKVRGLPFSVKWEKRGHQRGAERPIGGSQAQSHACGDRLELEDLQADTLSVPLHPLEALPEPTPSAIWVAGLRTAVRNDCHS